MLHVAKANVGWPGEWCEWRSQGDASGLRALDRISRKQSLVSTGGAAPTAGNPTTVPWR